MKHLRIYIAQLLCIFWLFPTFTWAAPRNGVITLSTTSLSFSKNQGTQFITISGVGQWSAHGEPGWISISPHSGYLSDPPGPAVGSSTIRIDVIANTGCARSAIVYFNDKTLSITQAASNNITLSPTSLSYLWTGGSKTVSLTASCSSASWSVQSKPSWVTVSPSSATGNKTLTITCTQNNGSSQRTGTINFGNNKTISITQDCPPPSIGNITGSDDICLNNPIDYSVSNISGVSYTWSSSTNLKILSGRYTSIVTVVVLTPPNPGESLSLSIQATSSCGVTSLYKTLDYIEKPTISNHPTSQTICPGSSVTYSVSSPYGGVLSYQWQKWLPNSTPDDWINLTEAGATTNQITLTPTDPSGTKFRCALNLSCDPAYSNEATLSYYELISLSPISLSFPYTVSSNTSNLTVLNCSETWSVQSKPSWVTVTPSTGTTSQTLTISCSENTNITDRSGTIDFGNGKTISITQDCSLPVIGNIIGPDNICLHNEVDYSVNNIAGVTYTWTVSDEVRIKGGQGTSTLSMDLWQAPIPWPGNEVTISVQATTACGEIVTSSKTLYYITSTNILDHPDDQVICSSSTGTFSVNALYSDALEYQWEHKQVGGQWTTSTTQGANTATVTAESYDGIQYRCLVIACSDTIISNTATLHIINSAPTAGQPANVTLCEGVQLNPSINCTGEYLSYQWQVYNSEWENTTIPRPAALSDDSKQFRCIVSNACGADTSTAMTVTINPAPTVTVDPESPSIGSGDEIELYASGAVSYSWSPTESLSSDTGSNVIASPLTTTTYTVIGTGVNECTKEVQRTVNVLSIHFFPVSSSHGTSGPLGTTLFSGITAVPNGGTAPYSYFWNNGDTTQTMTCTILYKGTEYGTLTNGIYSVKVNDANGLSTIQSYEITDSDEQSGIKPGSSVTSRTILIENITDVAAIDTLASGNKVESISYFDGLGRVKQSIALKVTPGQKDMVQFFEYDALGRQVKSFMPYADNTSSESLREHPELTQSSFYFTEFDGDVHPYSEVVFDNSPFNRILESSSPGDEWKINKTNGISDKTGHTTKSDFRYSTSNDTIYRWAINGNTCYISGTYGAKELQVSTVTDADGNQSRAYSNLIGQSIAKETLGDEQLTTYKVYDDFGRLIFYLPPAATDSIIALYNQSQNPSRQLLEEMAYIYSYDNKHRVAEKYIPGKGVMYIVYDKLNRNALSQDAKLRINNHWAFIKYDKFGRSIMSGIYQHASAISRDSMQSILNQETTLFETFSTSGSIHMYSNNAFPTGITESDVLNVSYYDNYNFDTETTEGYSNVRAYAESISNADFNASDISYKVKGMATGTKIKILDNTDTWMLSVPFYDKRGRSIRAYSENHLGGHDLAMIKYDFAGKVLKTKMYHYKDDVAATDSIETHPVYDHMGRTLKSYYKYNNHDEVLVAAVEYDEMGKVVSKKIHSEDGMEFLQKLDFTFNIKGQLTSLNDTEEMETENDLLAMNLFYHKQADAESEVSYTGKITALQWTTQTRDEKSQYNYFYDNIGRLTQADYKEQSATGTWSNPNKYDVTSLDYDTNGNILRLKRFGSDSQAMDDLSYSYFNNNQLKSVSDAAGDITGVKDFADKASLATEYAYDSNGNAIEDENKGISVWYNILNLPDEIAFDGNNKIEYLYSAGVQKLATYVYTNDTLQKTTDYTGAFVYENDSLAYLMTGGGKIVPAGDSIQYQYFLKDHQGNTRVSFTKGTDGKAELIQENHYYPFGMTLPGMNYVSGTENKYLYNGKELQTENGLEWYHYGFRFYDPQIGRWHAVDPMAEQTAGVTPYHYCYNNPINFVDIMGLIPGDPPGHMDPTPRGTRNNIRHLYGENYGFANRGNGGGSTRVGDPLAGTDYLGRPKYDENGSYISPTERAKDGPRDMIYSVGMGYSGSWEKRTVTLEGYNFFIDNHGIMDIYARGEFYKVERWFWVPDPAINEWSLNSWGNGSNNTSNNNSGERYGSPASELISLGNGIARALKIKNKLNLDLELSRRLDQLLPYSFDVNTGEKTWVNPKYAKNMKWLGYAGYTGDAANLSGIYYNIYIKGEGWTTRNSFDAAFGIIGSLGIYGDVISLPYSFGTSWMDYGNEMLKKDPDRFTYENSCMIRR